MYPLNSFNAVTVRSVYPTSGELESIGAFATSPFPAQIASGIPSADMTQGDVDTSSVHRAVAVGSTGKPLVWWASLAVLLVVLMYSARHFDGEGGSYANLRLSAYNIFSITLASIIGLSLLKVAATKFPVPGLSTVILAA